MTECTQKLFDDGLHPDLRPELWHEISPGVRRFNGTVPEGKAVICAHVCKRGVWAEALTGVQINDNASRLVNPPTEKELETKRLGLSFDKNGAVSLRLLNRPKAEVGSRGGSELSSSGEDERAEVIQQLGILAAAVHELTLKVDALATQSRAPPRT